jgi:hypothetical protein
VVALQRLFVIGVSKFATFASFSENGSNRQARKGFLLVVCFAASCWWVLLLLCWQLDSLTAPQKMWLNFFNSSSVLVVWMLAVWYTPSFFQFGFGSRVGFARLCFWSVFFCLAFGFFYQTFVWLCLLPLCVG